MEEPENVDNRIIDPESDPENFSMEVEPELQAEDPLSLPERTESSDLNSVEAVSSMHITPAGSPLGSNAPSVVDDAGQRIEDVSRAGRKRKANMRYMEEPSPVLKPAVRRPSVSKKAAPPSPKNKKPTGKEVKGETVSMKIEDLQSAPVVTGPPTFGSILFGRRRKLSESLSDDAGLLEEDEEEIPEINSEDEEEPGHLSITVQPEQAVLGAVASSPVKLEGSYEASGAAGPTVNGMIKTALVFPSDGVIKFPDIVSEEYLSRPPSSRIYVPVELGGGGPLSLFPSGPISWFRDEIPKLSAYFRKKMEGGLVPLPKSSSSGLAVVGLQEKKVSLTEAQREERRRQKEAERRRMIEERNRRRERERLKQLYRQHWLALTKFPIEDDLLHGHKGIRRLGHAAPQCRQISPPIVFWDCRLGSADALGLPLNIKLSTTELLDEIFVVWNFFIHFSPLLGGCSSTVSLPELVEGIFRKELTPVVSSLHWKLIDLMLPWVEHQLSAMLQAEQALESQLTKNRGRAKLYWSAISQFRDFLFLGYSVFVNLKVAHRSESSANWLWLALFICKAVALLDAVEFRSKEFLGTISTAFEEIDYEHKWIFDWELHAGWQYDSMPFAYRVKLLKLLIDKIVSLPVIKKSVDLCCEARNHMVAELAFLDKEERKLTQRIALNQKNLNPADSPELAQDYKFRDALAKAKRVSQSFSDKELAVRLESLGRDRFMNEYFQVSCDRNLVYVRQHSVSHPNVVRYGVYDSLANIEALIQSLDERGVREMALKGELQKVKTGIFSEMMARGDSDFEKTSVLWLEDHTPMRESISAAADLREEAREFPQLKYLSDCVDLTRNGLARIKDAWFGKILTARDGAEDDDDDVTVDEGMMSSSSLSEDDDQESEKIISVLEKPFMTEQDSLFESVMALAQVLTEGFRSALLAYPKPGETTASASSILIQFHVKSGVDLLKQVSIPAEKEEFLRLVGSLKRDSFSSPAEYKRKMIQISSMFLDGLSALDDVVHDEISRVENSAASSLEIWAASGGEKHAWKSFIGSSDQRLSPASPGGDEDEAPASPSTAHIFKCDSCEKSFKYHILLGIHKLHPCKTRGRKPIPVDPLMEVFPIPQSNGMIAIDRISNVEFPALPSARQEAAEKAEKASSSAALVTEGENNSTSAPPAEFVCEICGKIFPHNQGLAVHQTRWCIPEQQAQLILTAQQAVGGLAAPLVPDSVEGPVNCPTCGKLFPTLQGLAIHQTRWCRGTDQPGEGGAGDVLVVAPNKQAKILHVETLFRKPDLPAEMLVKVEDENPESPSLEDESESRREPGFTPACYSLAAISVAILWYATRLESVVQKFSSERPHHSRGGAAKTSKK